MSKNLPDLNVLEKRIRELELENKRLRECLDRYKSDVNQSFEDELHQAKEKASESEKQFRLLLDNAPEPIYIQSEDDKFVYLNIAASKFYGVNSTDDLIGTCVFDRIRPDIIPIVRKRIVELKKSNNPLNSVKSVQLRMDGTPVEVEVSAVHINYNNLSSTLVILKDVHERERAEMALKHSYDLMRYIIEHNRSAIAIHDRNLNYIYVSERYLREYNIKDPNIIGKHHYEVIPDLPQKWRDVHQRALKGEIISAENDQYIKDDGTIEWTRWECRPWYEADNSVGGIIIYTELITERKQIEQELDQKNEELNNFFDCTIDLLCIASTDGYFLRLNKEWEHVLGYSIDELEHSRFLDYIHPDDLTGTMNSLKRLDNQERIYSFTNRYRCKSGEYKWIEWKSFPSGRKVFAAARDITDRIRIETALRESKEQLRFAFEGSNDGFWDINMITNRAFLSARGCEILGYAPDEMTNFDWTQYIHPEDRDYTKKVLDDYLDGKSLLFEVEQRLKTKSGDWKWILARGKLVSRNENNVPERMTGTHTDITERKIAENEIIKLNEELEERIHKRTMELLTANKELEAFSYSVSHDLRSPLRAIIGYTNILLEDYESTLNNEGKRICQVIKDSAENMGKLIDDLLAFSRLSRNALMVTDFDMESLVLSVYNEMVENKEKSRIDFSVSSLPSATGDFNMLKQVWVNLISNALKYSSQNERIKITIDYIDLPGETVYFIQDNGIGFDMQYVNKLFGVFQRLHNTRDFEGTGVGLAIVQRIVHRHGGRVWAEGKTGQGATFYLALQKKHS